MRPLRGLLGRLVRRRVPPPVTAPPRGRVVTYAPQKDGRADPGEVVWAWVPYEDDPRNGKDRPVLVVGRDGRMLLGLYMSSNAARRRQRGWVALGTGSWDREWRPSFVRVDRVVRLREKDVRREGAVLDPGRFARVAEVLRRDHGWV